MKKCKRVFTMVIAAVLVFGIMVIPASAVEGSKSIVFVVGAYSGSGRFTISGNNVSASMTVREVGDGPIALFPSCKINGQYSLPYGRDHEIFAQAVITDSSKSMSCSFEATPGETVLSAYCNYDFNGTQVGHIEFPQ